MQPMPSTERLHELFVYDPISGEIRSRLSRGGRTRAGKLAGDVSAARGYIRIKIDGRYFYAHRIAWCMMTGRWPAAYIDHIDCDKSNTRWCNLREASKSQNGANRPKHLRNGTCLSPLKGVSFNSKNGKWFSQILCEGAHQFLGYFDAENDAHLAYLAAAQRLFGKFARAQ